MLLIWTPSPLLAWISLWYRARVCDFSNFSLGIGLEFETFRISVSVSVSTLRLWRLQSRSQSQPWDFWNSSLGLENPTLVSLLSDSNLLYSILFYFTLVYSTLNYSTRLYTTLTWLYTLLNSTLNVITHGVVVWWFGLLWCFPIIIPTQYKLHWTELNWTTLGCGNNTLVFNP